MVDTWWQTETGGIMITPLPGATPPKPGSATLPFFGVEPVVVDRRRHASSRATTCAATSASRRPWPGQARTLYGDHQRFRETYFSRYPGYYFTGDGCLRDEDGYYWITGRVDDVLNVSGHRLGTAEIESALVAHERWRRPPWWASRTRSRAPASTPTCCCSPEAEGWDRDELVGALKEQVRHVIGAFAAPDRDPDRARGCRRPASGKIMRRILRKIAAGEYEELGDITTLAEPEVVEQLVNEHRGA